MTLGERGELPRYQHGAAGDLSRLEPRIDVDGVCEWKFCRLGVDPAGARHRNHFQQFDARAPVRNAHRRSVRRASMAEVMAAAAQSNDRPHAVSTEQFRAQIQCWLHPNAIENQASPAGTRDLLYPLGRFRGVAVVYDVVRAERLGLLEFMVIDVSGDDAYRGEHSEKLNGHVSETADTENDNRAVRS